MSDADATLRSPEGEAPPSRARSQTRENHTDERSVANARLASPIPSLRDRSGSGTRRRRSSVLSHSGRPSNIHSPAVGISESQATDSALANALSASLRKHQSPFEDDKDGREASETTSLSTHRKQLGSNYGSIAQDNSTAPAERVSPTPYEDFDIVQRHLAGPQDMESGSQHKSSEAAGGGSGGGSGAKSPKAKVTLPDEEEEGFSSLRLQGGDVTRQIYRRTEAEQQAKQPAYQRRNTVQVIRPGPEDEELDIENIRQPGGFRRNHLLRNTASPLHRGSGVGHGSDSPAIRTPPSFVTRNFFEFLSLYGHFAGEDVDDDDSETSESPRHHEYEGAERDGEHSDERSPLLNKVLKRRHRQAQKNADKKGAAGTVFILLKSFVGTGVLFLPRAFHNGGMFFSLGILLAVSCMSYYCFVLLTTSRIVLKGSYAEMGEMTYGRWLRGLINSSLVISQIGFASAYIVFTSQNLQAFILAVSDCQTYIEIKLMILMQLIVFLPLALYRNLNNIAYIVYIADLFIVLGLVYLYYYGISTIATYGIADIVYFNSSTWTVFIGTAIFTFEGIGLLIPIQDGMKKPEQLPAVLGGVMIIITVIFTTMGSILYGAFGSKTQTVIILNMPQDNRFVNGVQFLYSLAILLSTPMQIFPAITIMEKGLFSRSGKHNRNVKWTKNLFRFGVVMASALIAWVGADDLDKFVSLIGSFACIPLVYIYPPLIHRRGVAQSRWRMYSDLVLCGLGFTLMTYTTVLTVSGWISSSHSHRGPKSTEVFGMTSAYCDKRGL